MSAKSQSTTSSVAIMLIQALILTLFGWCAVSEAALPPRSGCPEPIDVYPCECTNSPFTYLQCQHIDDAEIIRQVFLNSTRYGFREVHIKYSVLPFLPSDMFEKVRVHALYLKNVTLAQLFDRPPAFLENLDTLHIENTRLLRGIMWKLLEPLTHLRILNIYYNNIKTLGTDFSRYATKELKQISFYGTGTKTIKPGVFSEFVNLEKVSFENCLVSELRRDIFPEPFTAIRYIYFNTNRLTSIPDDMFSYMPNLQSIGLKHNSISRIPESAFRNAPMISDIPTSQTINGGKQIWGSLAKIEWFQLEGNPLICDCQLAWLIQNKPPALSGTCASPTEMQGKELRDIQGDYLKC